MRRARRAEEAGARGGLRAPPGGAGARPAGAVGGAGGRGAHGGGPGRARADAVVCRDGGERVPGGAQVAQGPRRPVLPRPQRVQAVPRSPPFAGCAVETEAPSEWRSDTSWPSDFAPAGRWSWSRWRPGTWAPTSSASGSRAPTSSPTSAPAACATAAWSWRTCASGASWRFRRAAPSAPSWRCRPAEARAWPGPEQMQWTDSARHRCRRPPLAAAAAVTLSCCWRPVRISVPPTSMGRRPCTLPPASATWRQSGP